MRGCRARAGGTGCECSGRAEKLWPFGDSARVAAPGGLQQCRTLANFGILVCESLTQTILRIRRHAAEHNHRHLPDVRRNRCLRDGIDRLTLTLENAQPALHSPEHLVRRLANDLHAVGLLDAGSIKCRSLGHSQARQNTPAEPLKFRLWPHDSISYPEPIEELPGLQSQPFRENFAPYLSF